MTRVLRVVDLGANPWVEVDDDHCGAAIKLVVCHPTRPAGQVDGLPQAVEFKAKDRDGARWWTATVTAPWWPRLLSALGRIERQPLPHVEHRGLSRGVAHRRTSVVSVDMTEVHGGASGRIGGYVESGCIDCSTVRIIASSPRA